MRFDEVSSNEETKAFQIFRDNFKIYGGDEGSVLYQNGYFSSTTTINVRSDLFGPYSSSFKKLPVKFKYIGNSFNINDVELRTLGGCPEEIKYDFDCSGNQLTTLEHGPKILGGSYNALGNPLETLRYLPESCAGIFLPYFPSLEYLRLFYINNLVDILIDQKSSVGGALIEPIILDILKKPLNRQQKILLAKRELIKHGYESNARL